MTSQFYQIEAVVQFSWLIDSFLAQRNAEMEKIISMCLNLLIWITERIYYQEMSSLYDALVSCGNDCNCCKIQYTEILIIFHM